MEDRDHYVSGHISGFGDQSTESILPQRSNALSNKITTVLSTSFADGDIREALRTLDERHFQNSAAARRNLRLDAQRDVIEYNGDIIKDFGVVAEVCSDAE